MITRFLNKIRSDYSLPSLGRGMGVGLMAFFGLFATTSCEDMLMTENDSMVIDPELDAKTDSVFYALGIAQAMQQVADQYFFVGEMRGDLVTTTTHTDNNLRQLADFSATAANKYDSAYVYYKVINNCNYYLAHRDTALYTGANNVAINEYAAVAAWRAWAYLQLARTYGAFRETGITIPFYTEPLTAISQIDEDNFPKLTLEEMVSELAPGLEQFSGLSVPDFGGAYYSIGNTNWGNSKSVYYSQIFVPVDVILGEMYLECGQYMKAAQHYCKYLCDNKLVSYNYNAGMRNLSIQNTNSAFTSVFPTDFVQAYNFRNDETYLYNMVFKTPQLTVVFTDGMNIVNTIREVLTYIPMAVSSQKGKTTGVPLAFGYDYYSTDRASNCPRVEEIQITPSATYRALTDSCDYYYYPARYSSGTSLASNPDTVHVWKAGDGRANYASSRTDVAILNRDVTDTTKVYIAKNNQANVYLFRTSTIYLHLAEALNRLGYTDIAFAILKNGISTYLEELVPGAGGVTAPYQYMSQESVDLLMTQVPFLDATNRNTFLPTVTYGIHHHGSGFKNITGLENNYPVSGSRATAVGSQKNMAYMPDTIIGMKMDELRRLGFAVGETKADTINAMEDVLCDEYAKEFAFEGIRFYDLQRMARHKNEAGFAGSRWFAEKLKGNNPAKSLLEPKNWYLPFK